MDIPTIELLEYLSRHREALRHAVDAVPPALRTQRPDPERWSVAEVLDHLSIVEQRVTQRLAAALEAARAGHPPSDATATLSLSDEGFAERLVDREQRFKTSQASEPRPGREAEAAWAALEATRRALVDVVEASAGMTMPGAVAPHPAFGPLTFRQWVIFVGGHDARHAKQVKEIGAALS